MDRKEGLDAAAPSVATPLARAVETFARTDGDHATAIPGLTFHRRHAATQPLHCIYGVGLGVVVQGAKQVTLGEQVVEYREGQSMLTTIDLPVLARVTRASLAEPFLGLMLTLDARAIMQTASEMQLPLLDRAATCQPVTIERFDPAVAHALLRLVNLLNEPALVDRLAPLIREEIMIRLLTGAHAPQLRHLVTAGAPGQRIASAVSWLKQNFTEPLHVDRLAERASMSPSTFRQHFRAITGMSPLQFQKQLRLQEARQLMLNQDLDAGHAGGLVGYESASQFNREYSRLFGAPPQRDVKRMRMN